jgi:gliding motility-associated protein GldE
MLNSYLELPVLLIVLFLLVYALIIVSGTETAFLSAAQSLKTNLERNKTRKARIWLRLLSNSNKLMATILVANAFLKTGIFITSFILAFSILKPTHSLIIVILGGLFSPLFIILLAEIAPRKYVASKPQKFLILATYWMYTLQLVFMPITAPFYKVILFFNRNFSNQSSNLSVDDLTEAIENASDALAEEEDILKGIVKFGNINVSEILRPRIDVVAVDYKMTIKQVLAVVVESGYSRIPVYAGNFDNVKGILFVKDLLPYIDEKENFRWQSLIRPPYFVPENKKVKELLTEFQASKIHMAVIVDEYGGTLGIVTLEDILEEIVGEISDESDEDERSYVQINDNTYIFDGKTLLNDFYKILQTDTSVFEDIKGDADTLAGLILELKGAIPVKNEQIKYNQFTFKIEAVDLRRIKQIRVTIK